ncbi:hypothetical protein [Formosa sp. L2A11]|uniref:hypothetical protein n=1 Tax=Formosa sp. L2A11 TaxID=2686363 RepID=UPI00131AD4B9|nr:hypothetical protein [Formosa sp. L2A11]
MSFFDTFFESQAEHTHHFPEPTSNGEVKIENNTLICQDFKDKGMRSCVVNLDDLQYVYIKVIDENDKYLFLFDHHQNDIPLTYKGFEKVYTQLSETFNFNDAVFFENMTKTERLKKQIWRRKYPKTYTILDTNYSDYNEGFEIQSQPKQFISWESTYDEIKDYENIYFEKSPYDQTLLKFKYPIRIGNVILTTLQAYFDNTRTDVPVLHYYCNCYNDLGNDGSYNDLNKVFTQDLVPDKVLKGYERADQKNWFFDLNNIKLSMCYTYDSNWQFDGGNTSITIKNQREYPELLIDVVYEKAIVISETLSLDGDFSCPEDYMRNSRIKYTPKSITEKFKAGTIIWTDSVNEKIGFASKGYAQVFDLAEIKALNIRNVLPARGRGRADLFVITTDDTFHTVLSGTCKVFDKYVDNLKQLSGKIIMFEPEYYDC